MIESLENIMKYNECPTHTDNDKTDINPQIIITKNGNNYYITSSNLMQSVNIPLVEEKIKLLNALDDEEMRDYYKCIITNGVFSNKGGAGLGLIEIAKASGQEIKYNFETLFNGYSRYNMKVVIEEQIGVGPSYVIDK